MMQADTVQDPIISEGLASQIRVLYGAVNRSLMGGLVSRTRGILEPAFRTPKCFLKANRLRRSTRNLRKYGHLIL